MTLKLANGDVFACELNFETGETKESENTKWVNECLQGMKGKKTEYCFCMLKKKITGNEMVSFKEWKKNHKKEDSECLANGK